MTTTKKIITAVATAVAAIVTFAMYQWGVPAAKKYLNSKKTPTADVINVQNNIDVQNNGDLLSSGSASD